MQRFFRRHPALREFLLFNLLSNCSTLVNFLMTYLGTHVLFRGLRTVPFSFLVFRYWNVVEDLGLAGFLSFLLATALAQTVNFFVQRKLVFHSSAAAGQAALRFALLAVLLVLLSAALPAYTLPRFGIMASAVLNIVMQVAISFPAMKFWIMPRHSQETVDR